MIDRPVLQDTSLQGPVSSAAARVATSVLAGDITVDTAATLVAEHFLSEPRAEIITVVLTSVAPDHLAGWTRLGGRACVREWTRSSSTRSLLPAPGAGPEAALTMPWVSRLARAQIVALTDRELLPQEAAQDREELARAGVRSMVASTFSAQGAMFGSLSLVGDEEGDWPEQLIDDFRLLNAALTARLSLEQSRRALAEAIDAAAEAQEGYQQLFGAVGHELRTPVSAVLGYTEALLDDAEHAPEMLAPGMLRDGPRMIRACEQLLAIVDSLLGAGRALASDDARQVVAVADAVADVVHWHRAPALAAHVEMVVDVDPDLVVWAHGSGVRQVLANLLGNAITHHRDDGGTVHLSAGRLLGESGQSMVRIVVRDDGPGLEPEQLAHAFDPFVRFAPRGTKGTGLGLSICRTVAERDGGAVRGMSTPGTGSSFWVELPAQPSTAAPGQ